MPDATITREQLIDRRKESSLGSIRPSSRTSYIPPNLHSDSRRPRESVPGAWGARTPALTL